MRRLYLLLATIVVASSDPLYSLKLKTCIDHCKCEQINVPSRDVITLQITGCDGPLILNETTFRSVDKPNINVVSFKNVIINQIQESVFKGFKKLEDVLILNSSIGSIDAKAFNHVKKLKFADCGFEDSPDLFSEKLEELHFGSCKIEEIPKLDDLLSLRFLNLSGNYIKDIGIETFAQLFDLEELHLSNNEIFKLPATLFINNQELNSLYLDNNPLKKFYLNTSEDLETLSLSNCHLETFDEVSTQRLSTLNELNLSNNKIKKLTGKTMSHMNQLSVINLANNQLEYLDDDIFFKNEKLRMITLDGNNFTSLPNFFLESREVFPIFSFSCNHCGLKTLPNTVFKNMPGLPNLQLSHNEFMNVDNTFQTLPSLKILDISHNNIVFIAPFAFANNTNLETLNLAGNPLIALNPEVFVNNRVIRKIDARNCSLEMLWSNKNKAIPSLNTLLLGNNKLRFLTIEDFKVTPNLVSIDLANNLLATSTDFCKIVNWLDEKQIRPIESIPDFDTGLDVHYIENPNSFDGFSFTTWNELYKNKCPATTTTTTTSPELWKLYTNDDIFHNDLDNSGVTYDDDEDEDDLDEEDDYSYEEEIEADEKALTKDNDDDNNVGRYAMDKNEDSNNDTEDVSGHVRYVIDKSYNDMPRDKDGNNLAGASYILSVTSVFILTALVVLTVAVAVTLTILRRNNNFNMHKANLPRLKIPMWHSTPGQKKHSGSVYRPLSEDLSGPKTPKLSRYEFTSTPIVHSSNP